VRSGAAVQTNIVRTNGSRGALLAVLKNGRASTLDIIKKIKEALPTIQAGLPSELEIKQLFINRCLYGLLSMAYYERRSLPQA